MAEPRVSTQARNVAADLGLTRARVGTNTARVAGPVSGRRFEQALRRAESLTDSNNHTEALKTFTDLFGYEDLSNNLSDIMREHQQARSLSAALYNRREMIRMELNDRIRRDYGLGILNRVYRAL